MSWSFLGTHRAGCGKRGQHNDGWSPNNFCPSLCYGTLLQYPRSVQSKALLFYFSVFSDPPHLPFSALPSLELMSCPLICLSNVCQPPSVDTLTLALSGFLSFTQGCERFSDDFLWPKKELQQAPAHCLSFNWNIKQWFTITQKFVSS